ncbi:alpha/beta hydrolase [Canibacter zhoujuaniae]|uniref:alpha/beta hydrolase n=1 Tax=Canibacter zhoujuaniae TaxID=2708343 RepID=UPI00142366AF|nr:alpha/beta fold hydrolase [Canibacter zhoujuaniae]
MVNHGISYAVAGSEIKGTIVALHGVTDNAAALSDLVQHYQDDWQIYAVDTLGHGLSRRFTDAELGDPFRAAVAAARTIVIAAARRSMSRKVVLLGHSMGGAIAGAIARELPDLIQALILEDPAFLTEEQTKLYRDTAADRLRRQESVTEHVGAAVTELMAQYPAWPASEYGAWAQGKTQVDRRFIAGGVVGVSGREIFTELAVPTLLVTGDKDDVLFGQAGLAEVASLGNPHIDAVLIPGASHTVRRDKSEEFYRALDSFLERCGQREALPTPYIAAELQPIIAGTPDQNTDDYLKMRRRGEKLLGDVKPAAGVEVFEVRLGGESAAVDDSFVLRCLTRGDEPQCVVLSIHGGGYVAGAARYDDARNSDLIEVFGGALVASPDYRLAPEFPWPAGATDCVRSLRYLAKTYPDLPLYIYSDSAGAGLAQQALMLLAESGDPVAVERAVLLEPCLEPGMVTGSFDTYCDGPIWTRAASKAAWAHYLGDPYAVPPYVPARKVAALMPPTLVIVNPVDPLRDEGVRFALDLVDAGVAVEMHMLPGTIHGALSVAETETWQRVKNEIRAFLDTPVSA